MSRSQDRALAVEQRCIAYVEAQGDNIVSWEDLFNNVDNHYKNPHSLKNCMLALQKKRRQRGEAPGKLTHYARLTTGLRSKMETMMPGSSPLVDAAVSMVDSLGAGTD